MASASMASASVASASAANASVASASLPDTKGPMFPPQCIVARGPQCPISARSKLRKEWMLGHVSKIQHSYVCLAA